MSKTTLCLRDNLLYLEKSISFIHLSVCLFIIIIIIIIHSFILFFGVDVGGGGENKIQSWPCIPSCPGHLSTSPLLSVITLYCHSMEESSKKLSLLCLLLDIGWGTYPCQFPERGRYSQRIMAYEMDTQLHTAGTTLTDWHSLLPFL